ncbi:MAG: MopE-related protein, partial [Phycisphaerales bacterium]
MNLRPTQSNTSSRSRSPRGRFAMSTSLQVAALLAAGAAGSAHAQSSTLTFWGGNGSGQSTVPAGLGGSTAIAGGGLHSVALTASGSVVCWGSNASGQTAVPPGLGIVQAIAAGTNHTLVVRADGTVASWGQNTGIGGALAVPAGVTGAVAAAAGNVHSIILKSAGTVQAWGTNSNGQVTIPAGLSGVTKIAAGSLHNIALRNTGTVTCWGAGTANTGLNFNYGQSVPPAGLANVAAIAGGQFHSLAARADGTVATWGQNTGTGGPLAVPAGLSGVTAVAAGNAHSVALRSNGTVVAWGSNASGQTTIPANLGFASRIASGGTHVGTIIAPPPTAVLVSTSAANCNTATGAIDVTVTNTTSTAWTGPNGFTASTVDLSNVAAGLYTLTASGAGGSVQLQVTVATAADTIDPVVSSYTAALSGAAGQNCSAAVPNFAATVVASDNCTASGSLSVTQSPVAGTARPLGNHAVVITVRDASGNETQVNAVFTVTGHSTLCFHDADADSFGNPLVSGFFCIAPVGYVSNDDDCDDNDFTVHPGADEECDEEDDDCDSFVDEDLPTYSYYPDADADGYGDGRTMITTCSPIAPPGYVANDLDCNDASAVVFPGAPETCANDGVDNDCDGIANEDSESTDAIAYFLDGDGDGFGAGLPTLSCSPIAGSVANSDDCNDDLVTYADNDLDGFGAGAMTACGVASDTDCNDGDASVNPNAVEDCANLAVDNDCDGSTADAEAIDATSYYADVDLDGFGAGDATKSCAPIQGSVTNNTDCQPTQVTYNDGDLDGFGAGAMTACGNAINATDCDDTRADVNPSAVEDCANLAIDNDCDGSTSDDEAVDATSYYADVDQDGFGAGAATKSCTPIQGSVTNNADCQPTQVTYNDGDLDGFGAGAMTACGNTTNDADCNDGDASVNPKAIENCANLAVDNDCDGTTSDAEAVDATDYYADADGDGFGAGDAIPSCSKVAGAVTNNSDCAPNAITYVDNDGDGFGAGAAIACGAVTTAGDCNDGDAAVNPSIAEICNTIDDDCDGQVDDGLVFSRYYLDQDQDTYGDPKIGVLSCQGSAPEGYVANATDCDDADAGVNPGADERCADLAIDNDCDGSTDESEAIDRVTFYADDDADTYGDAAATTMACSAPAGYVAAKGDCNDNDAAVNPAAQEICDAANTDEDCDGQADDLDASATGKTTFYRDADADGYTGSTSADFCDMPAGYEPASEGDCNDNDAAINPGAQEICDAANTDEDCDGQADDLDASATGKTTFYRDADADGYTGSTSADFC